MKIRYANSRAWISALLSLFMLTAVLMGTSKVFAAPGDLIWVKTNNPSSYYETARDIVVHSTWVYVVGYDRVLGSSNSRWRIEKRSSSTGTLIWLRTSNPSANDDFAYGVAVDNSGLYIVGSDQMFGVGNDRWRIEKRDLTTGALIWVRTSNPSSQEDVAYGVAVDGSGLYVVGFDDALGIGDGWNYRWRIEKRNLSTGALIWAKTSNPGNSMDEAYGVAVDSSGLYVVGHHFSGWEFDARWRIEKRNLSSGGLMWATESNPSTSDDFAYDVAVDSSGLYVAGCDDVLGFYGDPSEGGGYNFRWRIERRSLNTGALVWARTSNPSRYEDVAHSIIVTSSGLYAVGYDRASTATDRRWRIEKRNLSTGTSIWARSSNPSTNQDMALCVAADGSGLYVAGYGSASSTTDTQWRMEKRAL